MQLTLESETSVDLKTKMSLSEESVEKSALDISTGVQNGDIVNGSEIGIEKCKSDNVTGIENGTNGECLANGEITKDNVEAVDTKKDSDVENTKQIKESETVETIEDIDIAVETKENTDTKQIKESETVETIEDINLAVETKENTDDIEKSENISTKDNTGSVETKNDDIEITEQIKKSETVNIDINVIEYDSEPTISNAAVVKADLNDIDASTIHSEIEDKQEDKETAVNDNITTVTNEDRQYDKDTSDIKKEMSLNNCAESDSISHHSPEDSEVAETNENDIKQIMMKPETATVSQEENTTELDNIQIDICDQNVDSARLDATLNIDDKPSESVDNVTEEKGLSTVDPDVTKNDKTGDEVQMDVDSSVGNLAEEDTSSIDPIKPTVNVSENKECNDSDLREVDETEKTQQPEADSGSDNGTDNLHADQGKAVDVINVDSESNLTKTHDDNPVINCDEVTEVKVNTEEQPTEDMSIDEIIDLDETVPKESQDSKSKEVTEETDEICKKTNGDPKPIEPVLKLSNTLDILSDDEEEQASKSANPDDGKCINIEDDDDVMLIDDDTSGNESKLDPVKETNTEKQIESKPESPAESAEISEDSKKIETADNVPEIDAAVPDTDVTETIAAPDISEKIEENKLETEIKKPLIPENFLKTCKKNLADMTREELEEFCILKVVESILDRSNLSEIKNKLKTLTQNLEEYKKKAMMLSKQNRDLQVVFKSVQEDVKKCTDTPIVPLKITRSVGMQVLMSDKPVDKRRPGRPGCNLSNTNANKQVRNPVPQGPRPQKAPTQQIPVPRLVPATNNPATKSPQQPVNTVKTTSPLPNGVKSVSPVQKGEKRTHNRVQSVTVDLTDDEPPAKVVNRAQGPMPPVRLVPSQNLLAPPRAPVVNSPRKVYIPISGPQGQNLRPGQTIMLKSVPPANPRQRVPPPHMVRMPQSVRMTRPQGLRHPAPLPECMKQYQPPNWKALPPAPDLKLAKVENGIVISWKIEGYQEDSYEEIASYQLYAYQETSSPPNTALWKKIGDVKALPLPMACTLTQFMAGYKYYFAVRAVDIRSRLGPFSLPGSILLLNKM